MTSVSRVNEYSIVEIEDNYIDPPPNWPGKGTIEFKNVTLTYEGSTNPSLLNVNFKIHHNHKVAPFI